MLKTYQKYIIRNFLSKFFIVTLVFFSFIVILGSFEEITFFKNLKVNFLYPYLLTLLNAPITLFEIFPFIFLLTTQFLFYELFKKDELSLLKMNGLKNTSILKIILILAICIGVINVVIFYNIASNLKFHYLDIKNKYSNDNKYLAMVTKSGLWIKDEINDKKYIIKSKIIEGDFLNENIINEFDQNFNLIRTIQSDKINIKDYEWKILNPIITENNIRITVNDDIILQSNFNSQKISKLFSNISTLNIFRLLDVKKDFERLGYSSDEIFIHLLKLIVTPLVYGILVIISANIMFGLRKNSSIALFISIGFLVSVAIYYISFFFVSLGNNGTIPSSLSIIFPIIIFTIISIINLLNINEK